MENVEVKRTPDTIKKNFFCVHSFFFSTVFPFCRQKNERVFTVAREMGDQAQRARVASIAASALETDSNSRAQHQNSGTSPTFSSTFSSTYSSTLQARAHTGRARREHASAVGVDEQA
jgi:hypothetical protein